MFCNPAKRESDGAEGLDLSLEAAMPDDPRNPESTVEEPQQDPRPDVEREREVREPDRERWWENPGGGGEVH